MRAVVYRKPFDVVVEEVADPRIEQPNDAVVRITSSCICGSDLHMYEGRTDAEPGTVFGHENLGILEEVGGGVTRLEQGDRVVLPFNVACGFCRNCRAGRSAYCLTVNPPGAGGAYGYVGMGPYPGGQAEYLRVPFADYNCVPLPPGDAHEDDFALLADVFPTGYHATELARVAPGETVAVYGAGPVGQLAAYSALLRGAATVFVVDRIPHRLALAASAGAVPVDDTAGDPAEQIKDRTGGVGTDAGIDAVGYQATVPGGRERPTAVLDALVATVRPTGRIGVVGLYLPADPGGPDEDARHGRLPFELGRFFEKGLMLGAGQADAKRYGPHLRDLIIAGRARPGYVVSKRLPLEQAPEAYARFDRREDGYTKVILNPGR